MDRTFGPAQDTRPEKQDVIIAVCCLSASSADCANTRFLNVCILCVASGRVYASPEKSLTFRTDALLTRVDLIRDTRSSPVHSSPGPVAWRQSQKLRRNRCMKRHSRHRNDTLTDYMLTRRPHPRARQRAGEQRLCSRSRLVNQFTNQVILRLDRRSRYSDKKPPCDE